MIAIWNAGRSILHLVRLSGARILGFLVSAFIGTVIRDSSWLKVKEIFNVKDELPRWWAYRSIPHLMQPQYWIGAIVFIMVFILVFIAVFIKVFITVFIIVFIIIFVVVVVFIVVFIVVSIVIFVIFALVLTLCINDELIIWGIYILMEAYHWQRGRPFSCKPCEALGGFAARGGHPRREKSRQHKLLCSISLLVKWDVNEL